MVVHELVNRHQLDRGDVQRFQVVDDRRMAQAGIGPAEFLGDARMRLGHAPDVRPRR